MYPYEISGLVDRLPEYFQISFVYLAIWQWAGLIILIFLSFLIYIVFDKIIIYFLFKFWNRFVKREIVSSSLKRLSHPLGFLFILTLFAKFLPILSLPLKFSYFFNLIFAFAIPLIITYIIYRITDYVSEFFAKIADKTPSKLDDKIVPLVRKFLKVVVVIFGALYVLKNIGIDITPLLAGVSIGSLAVALAAQETLKNMFGSLTLFSDRVFELGDWIIAEDVDGRVEQVGIRSTKVRSFNDSIITVPNGKLADMNINNMGKRKYRRFATNLSVTYDTSISKIEEFIEGIRTIVNNHEKTRKDYLRVYLNNLGDSAIMILFDIFFEVEDYDEELKAKHEILSSIMNLASQLSVDFAFPTQTLHLEKGKSWVGSEKSEDSKSKHLHEDV